VLGADDPVLLHQWQRRPQRSRDAAAEVAGCDGFDRGADCDPLRGKVRARPLDG
jgi:hypothetical protein